MGSIESLTPQEAAYLYGVSVRTLRRAVKAGELAVIRYNSRVWRFLPVDLAAWYACRKLSASRTSLNGNTEPNP